MQIFNCVIAIIAIAISIYNILENHSIHKENKVFQKTIFEKDLRNDINKQRERLSSVTADLIKMGKLTDEQKKIYQGQINDVMESYLNALDYACDKYNEKLIDKDSFERNFSELIKQASQNTEVLTIITNEKRNKYKALKKAFLIINNNA